MFSDLMTSTMKSEPGRPSAGWGRGCGVPLVSAATTAADGRAAEGAGPAVAAAFAPFVAPAAAPATATPARNLRRSTFGPGFLVAIPHPSREKLLPRTRPATREDRKSITQTVA